MNRRAFLAKSGLLGIACSAGCTGSSSDGSNSATPSRTTPEGSASPAPQVIEELATARGALSRAFAATRSLDLIRGDRVIAEPDAFEAYDPEAALEHVGTARESLERARNVAGENRATTDRISLVANVATVAQQSATLYGTLRNVFRQGWYYEQLVDAGHFKRSVEELARARRLVRDLPSHQARLDQALTSVGDTAHEPKVEGFEHDRWRDVSRFVEGLALALGPGFAGFETYTEALIAGTRGREALAEQDGRTAYDAFQVASEYLTESREFLGTALDRDIAFFRDRTEGYWCRSGRKQDAYQVYIDAAVAFGNGDRERGERLRKDANRRFGEAIANCSI